jgi:hypothetical protein
MQSDGDDCYILFFACVALLSEYGPFVAGMLVAAVTIYYLAADATMVTSNGTCMRFHNKNNTNESSTINKTSNAYNTTTNMTSITFQATTDGTPNLSQPWITLLLFVTCWLILVWHSFVPLSKALNSSVLRTRTPNHILGACAVLCLLWIWMLIQYCGGAGFQWDQVEKCHAHIAVVCEVWIWLLMPFAVAYYVAKNCTIKRVHERARNSAKTLAPAVLTVKHSTRV